MTFLSISGYTETLTQTDTGELNLYGVGESGRDGIFSIDGSNGRLFTVTDDLSDSLFSVNTIAGLPVLEVFADNSVKIGQYGYDVFNISNLNVGIGTSTPNYKFHVVGSVSEDYMVNVTNNALDGYGMVINAANIDGNNILRLNDSAGNYMFTFRGDGYATLGTSTSIISVNGTLTTQYFKMTNGATNGYYLRSDASGNGTWAAVSSSQVYKGTWNANTNTPTLSNGTGTGGWYYRCTVAGTFNSISFSAGDDVMYNTSNVWERIPSSFTLVAATANNLGGIIVGTGLNVTVGGTLSVNSSSSNSGSTIVSRDSNGDFASRYITATKFIGSLNSTLYLGSHLSGGNFNNSSSVTITTDATDLNTNGAIVSRDGSGNFAASTITATLNGSSDKLDDLHGYNYVYSNNAVDGNNLNWNSVTWPTDNKITLSRIQTGSYTGQSNNAFSYGKLITFGKVTTGYLAQIAIGNDTEGMKYRCQYNVNSFTNSWRTILTSAGLTDNYIPKSSGSSLVNSTISESGSSVWINNSLTINNNLNIKGQAYSEIHNNGSNSTIDFNNGNIQTLSLTSNITITLSNPVGGGTYTIIITQGGVGGYSITWPNTTKWPDGYKPYLSSAIGDVDIITFVSDGTTLYGIPQYNFKI